MKHSFLFSGKKKKKKRLKKKFMYCKDIQSMNMKVVHIQTHTHF